MLCFDINKPSASRTYTCSYIHSHNCVISRVCGQLIKQIPAHRWDHRRDELCGCAVIVADRKNHSFICPTIKIVPGIDRSNVLKHYVGKDKDGFNLYAISSLANEYCLLLLGFDFCCYFSLTTYISNIMQSTQIRCSNII